MFNQDRFSNLFRPGSSIRILTGWRRGHFLKPVFDRISMGIPCKLKWLRGHVFKNFSGRIFNKRVA
jgi:hypothetical protein